MLPQLSTVTYNIRATRLLHVPFARTGRYQNTFFPYCISKWNELDPAIRDSLSLSSFKKSLLRFIRPPPVPIYGVHNPQGLMFLTRLRLRLSHLREHKFRHHFEDTCDPFCSCRTNSIETTQHFLLHCPIYSRHHKNLIDNLHQRDIHILPYNVSHLTNILLYGNSNFNFSTNYIILNNVINFILATNRFDGSLFN